MEPLIKEAGPGPVRLIANEPDACDVTEYREKRAEELAHHHISHPDRIVFVEITVTHPSEFETELHASGYYCDGDRVLRVASPAVANAIAALLLRIRDSTETPPHTIRQIYGLLLELGSAAPEVGKRRAATAALGLATCTLSCARR